MLYTWLRKKLSKWTSTKALKASRPSVSHFRPQLLGLEERVVPATFWVDGNAADFLSGGTILKLPNSSPPLSNGGLNTVHGALGTNFFNTVEDAVDAAQSNPGADVIRVLPGTYTLPAKQSITDPLSIIGYGTMGANKTTIMAGFDTRPSFTVFSDTGVFVVDQGISFNVSSVVLDGQAPAFGQNTTIPIEVNRFIIYNDTPAGNPVASSTISNVVFQNIRHNGNDPVNPPGTPLTDATNTFPQGTGVYVSDGRVDIVDCSFTNMGVLGVIYDGTDVGTIVSGNFVHNTYIGKTIPAGFSGYDLGVNITSGANVTATGNVFSRLTGVISGPGGAESAGIQVVTDTATNTIAVVKNNSFLASRNGMIVGIAAGDTSSVTISANNFIGNTAFAIQSPRTLAISATGNFYGSKAGPVAPNNTNSPVVASTKNATAATKLTFTRPTTAIVTTNGAITGKITGKVLAGTVVFLDANANGVLDDGEAQTVTDTAGAFSFPNLAATAGAPVSISHYNVREVLPLGAIFAKDGGLKVVDLKFNVTTGAATTAISLANTAAKGTAAVQFGINPNQSSFTVPAGAPILNFDLIAKDIFGNTVNTYVGNVTITVFAVDNLGTKTSPVTSVQAFVATDFGVHRFAVTAPNVPGTYMVRISAPGIVNLDLNVNVV